MGVGGAGGEGWSGNETFREERPAENSMDGDCGGEGEGDCDCACDIGRVCGVADVARPDVARVADKGTDTDPDTGTGRDSSPSTAST